MKTLLKSRPKAVLSLSAILIVVSLICFYSAIANPRRASTQHAKGTALIPDGTSRPGVDHDDDPEYVKTRREYLKRFFGSSGSVSPGGYAKAVAAARSLPPSPLLQGRRFTSPQRPASDDPLPSWTFPIPPPIINSYGGNASALIHVLGLDPTDHNVVYTGGFGGLAKSADGGETWQYLSDTWESQAVSSISVDPNAPNHVYVGTGSDYPLYCTGLYRSFDGGVSWTHLPGPFEGTAIRKVVVDPNSSGTAGSTTLYVANGPSSTSAGLWQSTDSGEHWTRLLVSSDNGIWDLAIDSSTNPSTIYVADVSGVSKGTPGNPFTDFYFIYYANANWNSGVRLSVVNLVPYLLAPSAGPAPINKLYRSQNGNQNWTEVPTICPPPPNHCVEGGSISPGVFAVDPFDPNIILIGTNTLYRTADQGAHWADIGDLSQIHPDQRAIAFSTARPGVVFSGNDGGISGSTAHGETQTWTNLNQNFSGALLYTMALSQDGSMIGGTQDNGVVFSDVGGTWDMIWGGDSFYDLIDPTDSTTAYFTTFYSETFRRYNKTTRESISIRPEQFNNDPACSFFPAFSMNKSAPTHLIAACQHVVQSSDRGDHWTTIGGSLAEPTYPPNASYNSVNATCEAPSNPSVIYAIAHHFRVWVTADANNAEDALWTDVTGNLGEVRGIYAVVVHPTNPQIAYLACGTGIYKTTTMGAGPTPWTNLNAPTGSVNYAYRDLVIDPAAPSNIIVASSMGVFATINGGQTWENMSAGIPAGMTVTGLSFDRVNRQLAASTYGRGAYLLHLPPVVSITSPANGAMISGNVTVSATASENLVGVQFKLDGANLGTEDTTAPYSVTWNTASSLNGSHSLTAVARDARGSTTTSTAVVVTVDNLSPTVSIAAPSNGAFVRGTVTVSATASDNAGVIGVQFKLDGANLLSEDTVAPYSISWNTVPSPGSHTLTAVARDAAGNMTTSAAVVVTVDNVLPTVSITAPPNGAFVRGTVTVSAAASDNVGVIGVQFKLDGASLGLEDTTAPYSVAWNTATSLNGSHTLTAIARDAAGNTKTSLAVIVTVDNVAPTVAITAPANGATVSGTITVSATASDNVGVIGVQFKLDGANLLSEDTVAPYSISWNTGLWPGSHTLTAAARDAAGNTATSAGVTVTVTVLQDW